MLMGRLLSADDRTIGLMRGQNEHLSDLYMLRSTGGKVCYLCDIVAIERRDAFVHVISTLCVTMEANIGEIGLYQSRLDIGDSQSGIGDVNAQAISDGLDSCLSSTIDVTTGISGITRYAANIYNMPVVAFHHIGYYEARHREQTFDVGVDHLVPIVKASLILRLKPTRETSIVDQHVN